MNWGWTTILTIAGAAVGVAAGAVFVVATGGTGAAAIAAVAGMKAAEVGVAATAAVVLTSSAVGTTTAAGVFTGMVTGLVIDTVNNSKAKAEQGSSPRNQKESVADVKDKKDEKGVTKESENQEIKKAVIDTKKYTTHDVWLQKYRELQERQRILINKLDNATRVYKKLITEISLYAQIDKEYQIEKGFFDVNKIILKDVEESENVNAISRELVKIKQQLGFLEAVKCPPKQNLSGSSKQKDQGVQKSAPLKRIKINGSSQAGANHAGGDDGNDDDKQPPRKFMPVPKDDISVVRRSSRNLNNQILNAILLNYITNLSRPGFTAQAMRIGTANGSMHRAHRLSWSDIRYRAINILYEGNAQPMEVLINELFHIPAVGPHNISHINPAVVLRQHQQALDAFETFLNRYHDPHSSHEQVQTSLGRLLNFLNSAITNLTPGHAATNITISDRLDLHVHPISGQLTPRSRVSFFRNPLNIRTVPASTPLMQNNQPIVNDGQYIFASSNNWDGLAPITTVTPSRRRVVRFIVEEQDPPSPSSMGVNKSCH